MSPHPIPSLSGFNPIMSRRVLFGGATAVAAAGVLSACGSSSSKTEHKASETPFYEINEQDASKLKQGGPLNLSTYSLGPDFNRFSQNGSSTSVSETMGVIAGAGIWRSTFKGEDELDPNYCLGFEAKEVDGKITAEVRLNPKAVFNDGTPIDIDALKATWQIQRDPDGEYKIAAAGIYEYIESVEAIDGDRYHARVVFKTAHNPVKGLLFGGILHPAMLDVNLFNEGFVDKPLDQYWAGPFKVGEWNSSSKVLTVVRNEKWWGTKPALERITWREMSSQAEQAAYKNGEIDYVDASTLSSYNELSGVANTDIRKGSALSVGNYEINPEKVPLPVRRAFVAALNREQLQKLRYEKLGWKETLPGSMCMLPMQEGYQDNYPTKLGKDVATKILEDAGYTKNGDYYAKDGAKVSYPVITFGSDPVVSSTAQFLVQQMKEIGVELTIENHGASEMSSIISSKNFAIKTGGYGITTSPVDAANYFYISETNNGHGKDLDSLAATMMSTEDPKEQLKIMNELEKRHLDEVAIYVPTHNGPNFKACRKGLANYGPMLFGLPYYNPNVWINVGWEK